MFGTVWFQSGNELKVTCPACDHKSFWVNPVKDTCYCFVCQHRAKLSKLLSGPVSRLVLTDVSVWGHSQRDLVRELNDDTAALPAGYRPVAKRDDFSDGWDYIESRGVCAADIEFGYTDGFSVVFPVRECGKVVYWQSRSLMKAMKQKTSNPKKTDSGIGRDDVVYRIDTVDEGDAVFVVEGIFDALVSGGVATLGKRCSKIQAMKIIAKKPSAVFICYDGDAHEQCMETVHMFKYLWQCGNVGYVLLPENEDPASLGRKGLINQLYLQLKPPMWWSVSSESLLKSLQQTHLKPPRTKT